MTPQTRILSLALFLAMAMIWPTPPGFAQTSAPPTAPDEDHSAHHPATSEGAPPAPAPESGSPSMQPGGMPMGMTGREGQPDTMDGDMKQMMTMMRSMMTMMSARTGMMSSHIEDRIASLKADLKITDAQAPQWNRFADALRATAKSMNGAYHQMMQPDGTATLAARLDGQEKMLAGHLTSLKKLKEALDPLYSSFSNEQKTVADGLMIGPMGIM